MCQGLAGGSGSGRGLASGGKVGKLVRGLRGLVLDVLGYRAWDRTDVSKWSRSSNSSTAVVDVYIPLAIVL